MESFVLYYVFSAKFKEAFSVSTCALTVRNGLGDRLLDSIGYSVISRKRGLVPVVNWCHAEDFNRVNFGRSSYDSNLFIFPFKTVCQDTPSPAAPYASFSGSSFNPDAVAAMFEKKLDDELLNIFIDVATKIKPSPALEMYISSMELAGAVGVHLRKSDKIRQDAIDGDPIYFSVDEFNDIMQKVKQYIISNYALGQRFYLCSEDASHKAEFKNFIESAGKDFTIVEGHNYYEVSDVLDFFCLSRCKEIIQAIKYSTFSMAAAIIGRKPLINISGFEVSNNLLNMWAPLFINMGGSKFDWSTNKFKEGLVRQHDSDIAKTSSCS